MLKFLLTILLLAPLSLHSANELPDFDLECLIYNVYYEARGESRKGKLAVALVTLNRADKSKSICKTVFEPYQFSWTIRPSKAKINKKDWAASKEAAIQAYFNRDILGVFNATHYHNHTVKPNWGLRKLRVIGNHIFYR